LKSIQWSPPHASRRFGGRLDQVEDVLFPWALLGSDRLTGALPVDEVDESCLRVILAFLRLKLPAFWFAMCFAGSSLSFVTLTSRTKSKFTGGKTVPLQASHPISISSNKSFAPSKAQWAANDSEMRGGPADQLKFDRAFREVSANLFDHLILLAASQLLNRASVLT
jgi:hypothetical protein